MGTKHVDVLSEGSTDEGSIPSGSRGIQREPARGIPCTLIISDRYSLQGKSKPCGVVSTLIVKALKLAN